MDESGWKPFYDRYPDSSGYLQMSAVGFNGARTRALVYMGHQCNNLCGGGSYHLMDKVKGAWLPATVSGVGCAWVS